MEKINHIEISNFKSIKHLKLDGFKKINVFIGFPNAGKSNVLEALGVSSIAARYRYLGKTTLKDFLRFSDLSNIFFEGDISNLGFVNVNDAAFELVFKSDGVEIDIFNDEPEESKLISTIKFSFEGTLTEQNRRRGYQYPLSFEVKKYDFITNFKSIRKYNFNPTQSLLFPHGENIGQVISNIPQLRKEVNRLLNDNDLKLLIERNTKDLKIFKEYQDGTIFTLPYNLIADTLQRLIFYKAAIISNENSVLLFEEPEAHCFEPYILEFTNNVKYDKNNNQFFIVTHSDFIIQEFLRDDESRENTNIYLVNNVDGETKVKLLEREKNEDVYELGMNPFFNFENLWETN